MRRSRLRRDLLVAVALAFLLALGLTVVTSPAAAPSRPPSIGLSADRVTAHGALTVTGRAPRGTRKVVVQLRRAGRWETVRVRRVPASGRYRLLVPTGWWGRRTVRVAARGPARRTSYSRTVGYTVTPGYLPLGRAGDHRLDERGLRWDPCRTVRWKYNPAGSSDAVLADVQEAFRVMASATGLRFHYAGLTSGDALEDSPAAVGTDILISWSDPERSPILHGRKVGLSQAVPDGPRRRYAAGVIVLDNTHDLRTGPATSGAPTWRQVALHELAHVLGLDHVAQPSQLMFETLRTSNHRMGAGDLAGLRRLGADRPCA